MQVLVFLIVVLNGQVGSMMVPTMDACEVEKQNVLKLAAQDPDIKTAGASCVRLEVNLKM